MSICLIEKTYAMKTLGEILNVTGGADARLDQVCCGVNSFVGLIITLALDAAGIVAFIMIIYASITYLTAYGEESKAETAKKTLLWSIVGLVVIVFSRVIMMIIYNYLK